MSVDIRLNKSPTQPLSSAAESRLRDSLANDVEFYEYAERRLRRQANRLGVEWDQ